MPAKAGTQSKELGPRFRGDEREEEIREDHVATKTLGIIMNGVTGRMGLNQHLVRSILAIREQGGVALPNGDRVMPDPILVGRNAEKIAALGKQYGVARTTTDLSA